VDGRDYQELVRKLSGLIARKPTAQGEGWQAGKQQGHPLASKLRAVPKRKRLVATALLIVVVIAAVALAAWPRLPLPGPGVVCGDATQGSDSLEPPSSIELAEWEELLDSCREQISELPFAAASYGPNLQRIAEHFWSERGADPEAARTVAIAYRLYAASIFFSPTGSTLPEIRRASQWVRRALELDAGFQDRRELEEANRFLMDILINQRSEVDLKALLTHQVRVAMVEASQADVDQKVEMGLEGVEQMIRQRSP
jgi:hypothetical protein